jgi:hypothetical protein
LQIICGVKHWAQQNVTKYYQECKKYVKVKKLPTTVKLLLIYPQKQRQAVKNREVAIIIKG